MRCKVEAELTDQQNLLDLCEKKLPGTAALDAAGIKKKVESLQKQAQKLRDSGASGAALAVCELAVSRRTAMDAENAREARAAAAEATAEERSERLEEICLEQVTAWEEKLDTIRIARAEREEAWTARIELLQGRGAAGMSAVGGCWVRLLCCIVWPTKTMSQRNRESCRVHPTWAALQRQ